MDGGGVRVRGEMRQTEKDSLLYSDLSQVVRKSP
jgi:hypothetical protein